MLIQRQLCLSVWDVASSVRAVNQGRLEGKASRISDGDGDDDDSPRGERVAVGQPNSDGVPETAGSSRAETYM
jgi:hypothetical protein